MCGDDDYVCQMNAFWTAPFMPNLLNSVVFLVETSQMISVFFANYKVSELLCHCMLRSLLRAIILGAALDEGNDRKPSALFVRLYLHR
jgi:hypothetical protein